MMRQVHFVTVPTAYANATNPRGVNTIASDQGSAVTFPRNTCCRFGVPTPGVGRPPEFRGGRAIPLRRLLSHGRIGPHRTVRHVALAQLNRHRSRFRWSTRPLRNPFRPGTADSGGHQRRPRLRLGTANPLAYDWATQKFTCVATRSQRRVNLSKYGVLNRSVPAR